jgi:hypothetical protein
MCVWLLIQAERQPAQGPLQISQLDLVLSVLRQ